MRIALYGGAAVAALLGLSVLSNSMGLMQRTFNPDNVIGSYEEFFDRCATVERYERSIEVQKALLEAAETGKERSRVRTNLAGLEAQRQGAISRYNAEANKMNVGLFRDNDLPRKLDPDSKTYCN